jgi:hypothetical protein
LLGLARGLAQHAGGVAGDLLQRRFGFLGCLAQHAAGIAGNLLAAYTKAFAEVGQARDEVQAKLAASPNKTAEAQAQLREGLKEKAAEIIRANGLTPAQYTRITWRVSVDNELRQSFEEILARLMAAKSSGP